MSARSEILARFYPLENRPLAHKLIFAHRHRSRQGKPIPPAPFHATMIQDWHGQAKGVIDLVFRGGAKSTIAEEAICIMGGFREFRNCLIIGEDFARAAQRLYAIRRELETNERLEQAFGALGGLGIGPYTSEDRIILTNGACIQALGMGQGLRGIKHEDQRPDLVFCDDIESRKTALTSAGRKKVKDWFEFDLVPALDPDHLIRAAATPLHPDSLAMDLADRTPGWIAHKFPIYYLDEEGKKQSSWPERFPIAAIEEMEADYTAKGKIEGFRQEYMCQSEVAERKPFRRELFRYDPRPRTWEAVYSMTDPARTVNQTSADTGRVVWSWIGPKLVVWDAVGAQWMPDEIVSDLFDVHEQYHPVWMGFEEDGLNLWATQAIRQEQAKRNIVLPTHAIRAPRDRSKSDFIRGLQPYFRAKEVFFVRPLPDLESQLVGFPHGKNDVPNALAYAIKMKPGAPIYDDFNRNHVLEDLRPLADRPLWLALNASPIACCGVLLQVLDGSVRIFADFLREGDPAEVLTDIVAAARLEVGAQPFRLTAGPLHFDQYHNVGLRQAAGKLPMDVTAGVATDQGRAFIRGVLRRERQGMPMLLVSSHARWVLNGFAGGYARTVEKGGVLKDEAQDGPYKLLMEGLESFLGLMELGRSTDDEDDDRFNAVTRDGRPYRSMLGNRR